MKKLTLIGLLISCMANAAEQPFTGWHWYNDNKPEDEIQTLEPPKSQTPDYSKMSPTELSKLMHQYTIDALNAAILNPTNENTEKFLKWKDFWENKASMFSESTTVAMLNNPDLDYNLKYSHYNSSVPFRKAQEREQEDAVIKSLSHEYALVYFFRGANSMDVGLEQTVEAFSKKHDVSMIAVTVDGIVPSSIPTVKIDNGQSQNMGVTHFPALFLVNPVSKQYYPLAYGFISQDDIAKRYVSLSTGFKPKY